MDKVEVVYISAPAHAVCVWVAWHQGMTVQDALDGAKILTQYPETAHLPCGVFSKPVSLDTLVKAGDRVEIYRPLTRDPKETRRMRAGKKLKK